MPVDAGPDLPPDWQEQMADWIRGAAPPSGDWFAGGPALGPQQQIGVYVRQFQLRLMDCLRDDVPGYRALAGDRCDDVLAAYLAAHPPRSWTLSDVPWRFAAWLAEQDAPRAHCEIAALDEAVSMGFEAGWGTPLSVEDLGSMPPLALQPHVRLLRAAHNVHAIRQAVMREEPLPMLVEGDFPLVVYRRGIRMRADALDPVLWRLLERIGERGDVGDALQTVVSEGASLDELRAQIGGWFRRMAEDHWVERAGPS